MSATPPPQPSVALSIRLDLPNGTRFGPGKAALLDAISASAGENGYGSISAAAHALGMSYPKALRLVEEMNGQFVVPLVESFQGGASRGGARLTPRGEEVRALYHDLTKTARTANKARLAHLKTM